MDSFNPEVKKEDDVENEASPSSITPDTSLRSQYGILTSFKEESEGRENCKFMDEVKEEIDIKIEEEDILLPDVPLMLCSQERPSLEEGRGEKRPKENHVAIKPQAMKTNKGDPSKPQHGKNPVIIKVSVGSSKSEDSKIVTVTPYKVILAYANSKGSSKHHRRHPIASGSMPSPGSDFHTEASLKENQQENYANPVVQDTPKTCAPVHKASPKKEAVVASRHTVGQSKPKQKQQCNTRYAIDQYHDRILAMKKKELEMRHKILEQQKMITEKEIERYKTMAELADKTVQTFSNFASTMKLVHEVLKRK